MILLHIRNNKESFPRRATRRAGLSHLYRLQETPEREKKFQNLKKILKKEFRNGFDGYGGGVVEGVWGEGGGWKWRVGG